MPAAEFAGWCSFLASEDDPKAKPADVESQLIGIFGVPHGS